MPRRSIVSNDGIYGGAKAFASGYGSYNGPSGTLAGGKGVGGTAVADVVITNNANSPISSHRGEAIDGFSYANAFAGGYNAAGGTANASTTITNSSALTSRRDGIQGTAKANASAYGGGFGSSPLSSATGGTAIAGVVITNNTDGTISSRRGEGIDGYSGARAIADDGFCIERCADVYTATGGTASATTTITNYAGITSRRDGIEGTALADASAFGSFDKASTGAGGSGTGGTAVAGVVITNNTGGTISSRRGEGIDGFAGARADGHGFSGFGGYADATTTITNFAAITSRWDGIQGGAQANASGYGSTDQGGKGVGGTAIAGVVITNNADGTISSSRGEGIDGSSYATANGHAFAATGGTASATTSISNYGTITSHRDGIYGGANAYANAYGSAADGHGRWPAAPAPAAPRSRTCTSRIRARSPLRDTEKALTATRMPARTLAAIPQPAERRSPPQRSSTR